MMNVLKFVIGSFAIISRAETPASESGIYRQYLLKFGKSFARMSEPARVATFFESVHYIYDYEMSKRNSAHGSSSTQYSLGFNEMTDWLPHEVESRFSMNQGNSSLSTSGAAVSKTNYVMESPGDGESTTEPVSDAEKVRRSVLSLEENFEREKVILNLLHFVAAAPAIDEDGEAKTGGLNWASDLNPRGSPVLSIVRNQVSILII